MLRFEPYDEDTTLAAAVPGDAVVSVHASLPAESFEPGDREQGDLVMLAALRRDGVDLAAPLDLGCFLDLPTLEAARAAAGELRLQGWATTVRPAPDERTWEVQADRRMIPSHRRISAVGALMHDLATRLGGAYDGWGVALP